MKLVVFGDSHSAFCFDRVTEADIFWLGPMTMQRFSNDYRNIVDMDAIAAAKDGTIAFIFGKIDIRCHIVKICQSQAKTFDDVASELATRYVAAVSDLCNIAGCRNVVIIQPPFPTSRRENKELPFVGTIEARIEARRTLSSHIAQRCKDTPIKFLMFPDQYSDKSGRLLRKYSDDGVHIMPCEAGYLIKAMERTIGHRLTMTNWRLDVLRRRINYLGGGPLRRRGGLRRTYL